MPDEHVLINRKNHIATITINRPRVMNALMSETISSLLAAFEGLGADPDIRVIVLEGAGGNFSAGADMSLLGASAEPWQSLQHMKEPVGKLILTMKRTPQPVICKIRGNVVGYAVGMALAADFAIAEDEAKFCEPFVNLGISLDGGASYFLPRLVGMAKAKEIALLGDIISGKEAAMLGLIYQSAPEEDLDLQTTLLCKRLLSKSARAMRLIKESLERNAAADLESALEREAAYQTILLSGDEIKATVKWFQDTRGKSADDMSRQKKRKSPLKTTKT
jgi:2-(1,2-epoxy-1,2-dihydrophenyl)acetyl-CoA isomerase